MFVRFVRRSTLTFSMAIAMAFLAPSEPVHGQSTPAELNAAGRFTEAAEAALLVSRDTAAATPDRCEAFHQFVYAVVRLDMLASVFGYLSEFERECGSGASATTLAGIERIRSELVPAPASTDDDWRVAADPGALGVDPAALNEHRRLCEGSAADACLVVRSGQIVQEWYGPRYEEPIEAMSSTKSVTGILTGMLIDDGRLSIDDPVELYAPEWRAGVDAGVTVRHLLSMTSGLLSSHVPRPPESIVGGVTDKDSLVFSLPLVDAPGEAWAYSNEGAYLLSPVLRRAAGEPIEAYAARRLFEPLGMRNTSMRVFPEGQAWTHATLWSPPRDLARIGQLMLQRGAWAGEEIVSEAWVEASVRPSQELEPDYGLLWWLNVPNGFVARGAYDTNVYVFPESDLVIVRMQAGQAPDGVPYEPAAFEIFDRLVP